MLPNTANLDDLVVDFEESKQYKNKTFGLNLKDKTVGGVINDLAALQQSIFLMLSVEADQYIIYPYTYGVNTLDLLGKPNHYVMAVLPGRITETLLSDDRITDVSDFEFELNGNKLSVTFTIHTIYGDYMAGGAGGSYITSLPTIEISLGEIELKLNSILAIQNYYINGGAE